MERDPLSLLLSASKHSLVQAPLYSKRASHLDENASSFLVAWSNLLGSTITRSTNGAMSSHVDARQSEREITRNLLPSHIRGTHHSANPATNKLFSSPTAPTEMLTSTVFRNAYFFIALMASSVSAAAVGSETPSGTSLSTNGTLEAGIGMAGPADGYYTISFSTGGNILYLGAQRGSRQIGLIPGGSPSDGNPGPSWLIIEDSYPTYYLKLDSKFVNPVGRTLVLDDYPYSWVIRPTAGPSGFGWKISSPRDGAQWEIPLVYPDAPVIVGGRGSVFQLN